MSRLAAYALSLFVAACAPDQQDELRRIDIDIAQARQDIQEIRAGAIRRSAERAALKVQFEDRPDLVQTLLASHDEAERALAPINARIVETIEQRIAVLERTRRALIDPAP